MVWGVGRGSDVLIGGSAVLIRGDTVLIRGDTVLISGDISPTTLGYYPWHQLSQFEFLSPNVCEASTVSFPLRGSPDYCLSQLQLYDSGQGVLLLVVVHSVGKGTNVGGLGREVEYGVGGCILENRDML